MPPLHVAPPPRDQHQTDLLLVLLVARLDSPALDLGLGLLTPDRHRGDRGDAAAPMSRDHSGERGDSSWSPSSRIPSSHDPESSQTSPSRNKSIGRAIVMHTFAEVCPGLTTAEVPPAGLHRVLRFLG